MERESPTNRYLGSLSKGSSPRALPTVKIYDTSFYVDVRLEEFRQTDNPSNRIPFADLNETPTGHNTFFYDTTTKNVYRGNFDEMTTDPNVRFIKLPSIWELDREGMNQVTQELAAAVRAERANRLSGQTQTPSDSDAKPSKSNRRKI